VTSDLRLELAAQRVRIAELEAKVQRLVEIVGSNAGARAMREEVRREREIDGRYSAIRAIASQLGTGTTETLALRIERIYSRELPPPSGAHEHIARLRQTYGNGGPSRRTIRRALTGLPNQCVNATAAENEPINHPHLTERT
jgi:hypothetical protein